MNRQAVAQEMLRMAELDPRFRVVYNFFTDLSKASKDEYITICRTRMPHLADSLIVAWPPLATTKVMQTLREINRYDDAAVVEVSAVLLDIIVRTVDKTIKSRDN